MHERRLGTDLARLCRDHDTFPAQREFFAVGQQALLQAIYRFRRTERWAREMGVMAPPHALTRR